MNSKKGAAPLFIIFSLIITMIAIGLLFTLVGDRIGATKKAYCKSVYNIKKSFGGYNSYCEEYLTLSVYRLSTGTSHLNYFKDKRGTAVLDFTSTTQDKTSILLPKTALLDSASLTLSLVPQSTDTFIDGSPNKLFVFSQPMTFEDDITELPDDVDVTQAKFELAGSIHPSKLDIVYIIDTSGSMIDEWDAVCAIQESIENELISMGLDAKFQVYGLPPNQDPAATTVSGLCSDGNLSRVETRWAAPFIDPGSCDTCGCSRPPSDSADEAWAHGSIVLMKKPIWQNGTDVKRILIPVSDSDPSGMTPSRATPSPECQWTDYLLSGTEQQVTDALIANASSGILDSEGNPMVFNILPVFGKDDNTEPEYTEGLHSGLDTCRIDDPSDTDICDFSRDCEKVYCFMDQVARGTGAGSSVGFEDAEKLKRDILSLTDIPFPSDIQFSLSCGASPPFFTDTFPGELNLSNGPWISIADQADLNAIESCTQPLHITLSSDPGSLLFSKIRIWYLIDMDGSMRVGSSMPQTFDLEEDNSQTSFDITQSLQSELEDCITELCEIEIEIQSGDNGLLMLSNLSVDYTYYDIREELLDKVLECWNIANRGQAFDDIQCSEISVPEVFDYVQPITEQGFTLFMQDRNVCHILANSDHGCGYSDQLNFAQDLYNAQNILIEYKSDQRKVVVS